MHLVSAKVYKSEPTAQTVPMFFREEIERNEERMYGAELGTPVRTGP